MLKKSPPPTVATVAREDFLRIDVPSVRPLLRPFLLGLTLATSRSGC
jgi:hypothetical protein